MMENFGSAAARHWEDAQRLHVIGRADNSAYLAGYAIECSLKVLIEITGQIPKHWVTTYLVFQATRWFWPACWPRGCTGTRSARPRISNT